MEDSTQGAVPTDWLELARNCIDREAFIEIVKTAVGQAAKGDRYARDFISSFLLPKEREPSRANTYKEIKFVLAPERGSE